MAIWLLTFMGDLLPEALSSYLQRNLLDVKKDKDDHTDSPYTRQFAGLMYLVEDTLTGQIMKYVDHDQEDLAYNIYTYEKKSVLIGLLYRSFFEDLPQVLLQMTLLTMVQKMNTCNG